MYFRLSGQYQLNFPCTNGPKSTVCPLVILPSRIAYTMHLFVQLGVLLEHDSSSRWDVKYKYCNLQENMENIFISLNQ